MSGPGGRSTAMTRSKASLGRSDAHPFVTAQLRPGTPTAMASELVGCCLATTLTVRIQQWRSKACRTRRIISSVCFPLPGTRGNEDRRHCSVRRRIPPVHGLQGSLRWIKQGDGQRCQENRVGDPCHIGRRRHRGYAPGVVHEGRTRQLMAEAGRVRAAATSRPAGLLTSSMRTFDGSSTNATRRSLTSRGSPVTCTPFCFGSGDLRVDLGRSPAEMMDRPPLARRRAVGLLREQPDVRIGVLHRIETALELRPLAAEHLRVPRERRLRDPAPAGGYGGSRATRHLQRVQA